MLLILYVDDAPLRLATSNRLAIYHNVSFGADDCEWYKGLEYTNANQHEILMEGCKSTYAYASVEIQLVWVLIVHFERVELEVWVVYPLLVCDICQL